jgi:hypothetical protein
MPLRLTYEDARNEAGDLWQIYQWEIAHR